MQYREYGRTGVQVSVLGFGAMRLPGGDAELSVEIMRRAFDLGVNYVDTAAMYGGGRNETLVGKALQGRRDKVYLSTKNHYKGRSAGEWQAILELSLRRLDTDYIDFYHLHDLKWYEYQGAMLPGKVIERFQRAKDESLIRHICFSSHDDPKNIMRLINTGIFEGMLVQYSLLDRRNEEAIAHAHAKGLGVAIMGPVAGGRLATPPGAMRDMVGVAKSTPEIALRFVISNPHVTLALSGMTSIAMVEQNVAAVSRGELLTDEERERVAKAVLVTRRLSDLYCTGCGYCMPCPNSVDIPGNLAAMNYQRVWGLEKAARERYTEMGREQAWAEACIECGECEPKCPQKIPIREWLKETAGTLGG